MVKEEGLQASGSKRRRDAPLWSTTESCSRVSWPACIYSSMSLPVVVQSLGMESAFVI